MNDLRRYFSAAPPAPKPSQSSERRRVEDSMDEDENEDELSAPIVVSDIVRPGGFGGLGRPRKIMNSPTGLPVRSTMAAQEALSTAQQSNPSTRKEGPRTQADHHSPGFSRSPSQMRLAVHIRSSPITTPFTPVHEQSSNASSTLAPGTVKRRGRPPRQPTIAGASVFEGVDSIMGRNEEATRGTQPKKRGRPKGWRAAPYSTDHRPIKKPVPTDANGQPLEVRRRGRPAKAPEITPLELYLQQKPDFTPYKCDWDITHTIANPQSPPTICPAELQNLDTLRRHVFKLHGHTQEERPLVCRFSSCKDQLPKFDSKEAFERHVEKKHLEWYAWNMGDGPQNSSFENPEVNDDDKPPAYLFDKNGVQVTPWVKDQRFETEAEHKERKRKLKRLLYEQNEKAPTEQEWAKQMLGVAEE